MSQVKIELPEYCNPKTAVVIDFGDPDCEHKFTKTEGDLLVTWECELCHKKATCEVYE